MNRTQRLGAIYVHGEPCRFLVWAPNAARVEVVLHHANAEAFLLEPIEQGYHCGSLAGVLPGNRYSLRLDGQTVRPDPCSQFQPEGVHGPSEVVDPRFAWTDEDWAGLPLEACVFYELHVGTYTSEGTFAGVERHLESLRDLGVTAIELMPVAQFPGERNWGYDGVFPFAAQNSYGGPTGLKHLVNAAHEVGLAILLDVVYNHLGPEGNYLRDFGPYFTPRYQTPWGAALNFDGPQSDHVRRFFIEDALQWVDEFHFDGLRLDAVHAIVDNSAYPFIQELTDAVHARARKLGRPIHVIAETDANDSRVCRLAKDGGVGCDAQWSDDVHHALHARLTGERAGYYADFGELDHVVAGLRDGYVYQGQYSAFRQRRHGTAPSGIAPSRFVVCAQNHDQVGNRATGDRLSSSLSTEALKLVAGAIILSPFTPLLFMGEEHGETAPFQYFVDHSDPELIAAVRRGRRDEFASFSWMGELPDPQAEATFLGSRVDHSLARAGRGALLREYYRELLRIRRSLLHKSRESGESTPEGDDRHCSVRAERHHASPAASGHIVGVRQESSVVSITYPRKNVRTIVLLNFGETREAVSGFTPTEPARIVLDSSDQRWDGPREDGNVDVAAASRTLLMEPHSVLVIRYEVS